MKRVAVVGIGKMGMLHASLLNTLPDVQLVALCEKSFVIRRFCKKILEYISVVSNVKELSGLGLDAVYVTTPIASHFPIIKAIYTEGIARNIFVEKPLASSYAEANELCDLAKRYGGVNMVGYSRRFAVTFGKAKEILDEGILGEPIFFEGYAYSSDFFEVKVGSQRLARGGVLRDLGCHAVDLALWFFGELETEMAKFESGTVGSEDSVYFRVKAPDGLAGELRTSWSMKNYRMPEIGLIIKGSKGMLRVNDDKVELRLDNGKSRTWHKHDLDDNVFFFLGGTEYLREDELFIRSIFSGCNAEPSFQRALKIEQIIEQVKNKVGKNEHSEIAACRG
ncbi:MAG: Gfo/Idh/MocA family oxidoreductase [Dehalococcoidia bacterium]